MYLGSTDPQHPRHILVQVLVVLQACLRGLLLPRYVPPATDVSMCVHVVGGMERRTQYYVHGPLYYVLVAGAPGGLWPLRVLDS